MSTTAQTTDAVKTVKKPPRSIHAQKGIPDHQVIACIKGGLNMSETARLLGCSTVNISRRFHKLKLEHDIIADHDKNWKDRYLSIEHKVLSKVKSADINKASLRDKVISAGICRDKIEGRNGALQLNINLYSHITDQVEDRIPQDIVVEAQILNDNQGQIGHDANNDS